MVFMEKDFGLVKLFELYKGLLTEKQRQIFASFYLYDLSLSEIAEPEGNTRQSVYNAVKQVKNKLLEYESVLKLSQKYQKLGEIAEELKNESNPQGEKITEILDN